MATLVDLNESTLSDTRAKCDVCVIGAGAAGLYLAHRLSRDGFCVIVLEAGPVYAVFMAGIRGRALDMLQWAWLIGSFCLVIILCVLAVAVPMKMGEKRLRR